MEVDGAPEEHQHQQALSEDERRRHWSLLEAVLDTYYLFQALGSYLDTESLASLYLALPPQRRDQWFCRHHLATWGKRHERASGECLLRLNPASTLLNMRSYLSFRHLFEHARWQVGTDDYLSLGDDDAPVYLLREQQQQMEDGVVQLYRVTYHTHLFRRHLMDKGRDMLVRACLFLPVQGPPQPFAGNLVVLGVGGHLFFYAPTLDGFRLVCNVHLQCSPHSLTCAPRGTALLAAHENSVFVALDLERVHCIFTRVHVAQDTFLGQCFTYEDTFVTGDEAGNVWEHRVVRSDKRQRRGTTDPVGGRAGSVVTTTLLLDHRAYGPNRWPFFHGETTDELVLAFKPGNRVTEDCLLLAGKRPRWGLGSLLRLVFSPGSMDYDSNDDAYVSFPQSLVASLVVHPGHQSVFVVVLTKLTRKAFLEFAPPVLTTQPRHMPPRFDLRVTGVVAVYELRFLLGRRLRVVSRYFLDAAPSTTPVASNDFFPSVPLPAEERRAYRMYSDLSLLRQTWRIQVQARCGRTHLTLRLDENTLAHIPLISTADSTVFCQGRDTSFRVFAFSEHHSFGFVAGAGYGPRYHTPLMSCVKYNRFFPDVLPSKIDETPPRVVHSHAILQGL